jgi:hypothetical protein
VIGMKNMPEHIVTNKDPLIEYLYDYAGGNPDDLEAKKPGFLKKALSTLAVLGMLYGCPPKPEPPKPPQTEVKIEHILNTKDAFSGSVVTGKNQYIGNGKDVQVNTCEKAELGTAPEGEKRNFMIYVRGNGALERRFNVSLSGSSIYETDLFNLSGFDISAYIDEFLMGNKNNRWDMPNVKVSFNPDNWEYGGQKGTGKRLPPEYINVVKNEITEVLLNNGSGFIKSLTFDENGDKIGGAANVPPDGEVWVFYYTFDNSVGNFNYPIGGSLIKSAKLVINPERVPTIGVPVEVRNMFVGNDQPGSVWLKDWKGFYRRSFKRPAGDAYNYRIFTDHEEQNGFDGTVTPLASTYVLVESYNEDRRSLLQPPTFFGEPGEQRYKRIVGFISPDKIKQKDAREDSKKIRN